MAPLDIDLMKGLFAVASGDGPLLDDDHEAARRHRRHRFAARIGGQQNGLSASGLQCSHGLRNRGWLLAQQGAEVIFVLSNGPTRGARPGREVTSVAVWRELLQTTAQFQTTWMVYVNRVGCEDGLTFGGGSLVVDPFGRVVSEAPALDEALEVVDLKSEILRRARTAYPLLRDENIELVQRELERIRQLRYDLPEAVDNQQ